jgi:hypothetical protein
MSGFFCSFAYRLDALNFSSIFKPSKVYTCNECSKKFEDFYIYCSHLIKGHHETETVVNCPVCQKKCTKGPDYQAHIRTHLKNCKIELNRLNKSTDAESSFEDQPPTKKLKAEKFNEVILLDE